MRRSQTAIVWSDCAALTPAESVPQPNPPHPQTFRTRAVKHNLPSSPSSSRHVYYFIIVLLFIFDLYLKFCVICEQLLFYVSRSSTSAFVFHMILYSCSQWNWMWVNPSVCPTVCHFLRLNLFSNLYNMLKAVCFVKQKWLFACYTSVKSISRVKRKFVVVGDFNVQRVPWPKCQTLSLGGPYLMVEP